MVFEGNSAMAREIRACTEEDLGYQPGDPFAETVDEVNASGAHFQIGQHRPREGDERRPDRVGVPPADPVGQLRHRPDRASPVHLQGRQGLPVHDQPPQHVRGGHRRTRGRLRLRRRRHPQRLPAAEQRLGSRAGQPDEPELRRRSAVRPRLQPAPGALPGVLALRDARRSGAVVHRHDRHARRLRPRRHPRPDGEDGHQPATRRASTTRTATAGSAAGPTSRRTSTSTRAARSRRCADRVVGGCPGAACSGASTPRVRTRAAPLTSLDITPLDRKDIEMPDQDAHPTHDRPAPDDRHRRRRGARHRDRDRGDVRAVAEGEQDAAPSPTPSPRRTRSSAPPTGRRTAPPCTSRPSSTG